MKNLFAYGTLMCEDIMFGVSGCRLPQAPGTLKGYSRRSVKGEHYPAIVSDKEDTVRGVVYRNVPDSGWERLDRFEGEMYRRQSVAIELDGGEMLYAETYIIQEAFMNRLSQSKWEFDHFITTCKENFQRNYKGYHLL